MSWINFLDIVYPTGSLYMNTSDTSPASGRLYFKKLYNAYLSGKEPLREVA